MIEESQKVNTSTIPAYKNAPLMASFAGTKDIIAQFIVIRYRNGKFYFSRPVKTSCDIIYMLTDLSNKGKPVPVRSNSGLVEKLIGTPA